MKISVIFGVLQMSIGILLKGLNSLYYRQYIDFCFEFLPQIIVLLALFGYMDALIIQKWLTDFSGREGYAPSVIATMIDMFLNGAKPSIATDEPLFTNWEYQTKLELNLLIVIGICIPAMLLVKPFYILATTPKTKQHNETQKSAVDKPSKADTVKAAEKQQNDDDGFMMIGSKVVPAMPPVSDGTDDEKYNMKEAIKLSVGGDSHGSHHDFTEVMIHQLIETIEFVLGTVSNTASYLRLWALSLAHSQLALVFFDNCLVGGFVSGSIISLYFGFFVYIGATIFVLMLMDLLECSLHTLRLHWVEFQNKFYKG